MRADLESRLNEEEVWFAEIVKFREFERMGKKIREYLLKDVENEFCTAYTDHIIWRLGRDVPKIPLIYGRLGIGGKIKFIGRVVKYSKYSGTDYTLKLIKLLRVENSR